MPEECLGPAEEGPGVRWSELASRHGCVTLGLSSCGTLLPPDSRAELQGHND